MAGLFFFFWLLLIVVCLPTVATKETMGPCVIVLIICLVLLLAGFISLEVTDFRFQWMLLGEEWKDYGSWWNQACTCSLGKKHKQERVAMRKCSSSDGKCSRYNGKVVLRIKDEFWLILWAHKHMIAYKLRQWMGFSNNQHLGIYIYFSIRKWWNFCVNTTLLVHKCLFMGEALPLTQGKNCGIDPPLCLVFGVKWVQPIQNELWQRLYRILMGLQIAQQ